MQQIRYKLANVIFSGVPQLMETPALCCRRDGQLLVDHAANVAHLYGPGTFDFATYFNALSVKKWQAYTVARKFYLHIELRGDACALAQTRCGSFSWYADPVGAAREIEPSEEWRACDVELAVADGDVFEAFAIETDGTVDLKNAYYYTEVSEQDIRNVELSICTTTFKKESYIKRNIELIRNQVLDSDEPIAKHFQMHVIDNGRTLDAEALSGDGVYVHPNDNVGGAGGFARGMIEAHHAAVPATHVLLMDDDVTISPESIKRTYNLLGIVNDEHKDAFVSGAMLNFDEPDAFIEDTGYMSYQGMCRAIKATDEPIRTSILHDCVRLECLGPRPELRGWSDQSQQYAAWWYCCIPMTTIDREGMPLPLFVRYDDAEYGMRCAPKFMTMTGICVWHLAFKMRYNAAVERYQTARNGLVISLTTGVAPQSNFLEAIRLNFELDLKKFDYDDAELTLTGFEDFLKGPERVFAKGFAEKRFMDANHAKEKHVPIDELAKQVSDQGISIDVKHINGPELDPYISRSKIESLLDYVSVNGQRVVPGYTKKGKTAVIEAPGWTYPAYVLRQCDTVVAIDLEGTSGVIRHKDPERFKSLWARYKKDLKTFKNSKDRLTKEYAEWRPRVTSEQYWKDYLGIQ